MAESNATDVFLPQSLPFPIKIIALGAPKGHDITRGSRLLTYSFLHFAADTQETRFGTWDAAIEGSLETWNLSPGDVVSKTAAKDKPALMIIEPCKHGMQHGGLCVLCGKDMTNIDYTGFSDTSRASIQMTHSAFGPTVSLEEAQRIERENAQHLLKSRKLSLIVDLDQTIVHATVDPTVGEWIEEGKAWELRHKKSSPRESDDSDDSESESSDDECNPNWESLKDVKQFSLGPESFSLSHMRAPLRPKDKDKKRVETAGCMYYIKPRPGWQEFLAHMSIKYDMHVYTMGTRAYAEEVCAAIDPDGSVFKSRILSRDESGSMTQKSLQRLFPCDTSMVVIIDDRADVWEWSPNLIKVIPYDFFVGIGDINSSFLAKVTPLNPSQIATNSPQVSDNAFPGPTEPPTPEEIEKAELEQNFLLSTNIATLEKQFEQRPLAKKQEELSSGNANEGSPSDDQPLKGEKPAQDQPPAGTPQAEKPKQALLKNDDTELSRISKLLDDVHQRFFETYDLGREQTPVHDKLHDVTKIIPRLRSEVLAGVHIVFSGVIPLDTPQETTELWRLAHMFGAKCYPNLTPEVTHVVTAKRGTKKVEMARKRGGIKIVRADWLNDCIALWHRQEEDPYLFYDSSAPVATTSPHASEQQIPSDPEPDADDWGVDPVELKAKVTQEAMEVGHSGAVGALHLDEIDWNDINDEVEAAMMESDEESIDEFDMGKSEDELTDEGSIASTSTPRFKRKRLRSLTPSEARNGDDSLRSPLAKRKKLAADRYSRLKEGITAEELESSATGVPKSETQQSTLFVSPVNGDVVEEEENEEDDDLEDDFLARDLQEEWG